MKDSQGVLRGRCKECSCKEYARPKSGNPCDYCGHYPAAHQQKSVPARVGHPAKQNKPQTQSKPLKYVPSNYYAAAPATAVNYDHRNTQKTKNPKQWIKQKTKKHKD